MIAECNIARKQGLFDCPQFVLQNSPAENAESAVETMGHGLGSGDVVGEVGSTCEIIE